MKFNANRRQVITTAAHLLQQATYAAHDEDGRAFIEMAMRLLLEGTDPVVVLESSDSALAEIRDLPEAPKEAL